MQRAILHGSWVSPSVWTGTAAASAAINLHAFHRDKTAHWAGCLSTIPDGGLDALMFRNRPQGRLVSA
jgi:hypothetical protein